MTEQERAAPATGTQDTGREHRLFMRRPWLDDLPALPALPADYVLRSYEPGDLAALGTLLTRAFDETWDDRRVTENLTDDPNVDTVFVIAHDGALVATATALLKDDEDPESGVLHWVGADPAYQGKGLGATVSVAVLRRFRELGLRDSVLLTQDYRLPAVRSYLRIGFIPEYRDRDEQMRWARLFPTLLR